MSIGRAFPVVIAVVLLLVVARGWSGDSESQQVSEAGRVCFPAEKWDADDAQRPCAAIVRLWEDGSVKVAVSAADGSEGFVTTTGSRR